MKPEPKFVPGERVVILNSRLFPEKVGSTTEVLSLKWGNRWDVHKEPAYSYKTKENCQIDYSWHESQLGKLPPNTPTTFDESIWKPSEVTQ